MDNIVSFLTSDLLTSFSMTVIALVVLVTQIKVMRIEKKLNK